MFTWAYNVLTISQPRNFGHFQCRLLYLRHVVDYAEFRSQVKVEIQLFKTHSILRVSKVQSRSAFSFNLRLKVIRFTE